jgi:peptide deformylase
MSLLSLHLLGSPVLRQRSAEVGVPGEDVRRLVDDLFETMDAARGVGLAANQVGVARRVAVMDEEGSVRDDRPGDHRKRSGRRRGGVLVHSRSAAR